MAVTVKDVDTLQEYIKGVMGRADHHAGNVNEIALALAGTIVNYTPVNESPLLCYNFCT